jgi:DNA processing protein
VDVEVDADTLQLAVAVTRYGHGPRKVSGQLRQHGIEAARTIYDQLDGEHRDSADGEAHALATAGVAAVLLGGDGYPVMLADLRQAPPTLFYRGNRELLGMAAFGICGSRDATKKGLTAARACGEEITRHGLVVVSGYARGVDTEAHVAALDAGGRTVMVLPEGITRFKAKSWLTARSYKPTQMCVV